MNPPTNQGWQCPCCETVYAPHVSSCKCKKVAAIKPQQPLTDNDKWRENEKMREDWERVVRAAHKMRQQEDQPPLEWYKVNPLPYGSTVLGPLVLIPFPKNHLVKLPHLR